MQFYEAISGGRIHSGYLRTGAISHYIPNLVVEEVILLCTDVPVKLQEIHNKCTTDRNTQLAYGQVLLNRMLCIYLAQLNLRGCNPAVELR